MLYLLIIIFYLLFTWVSHRDIRWGIYLTLLFLPSYLIRFQILGMPATLLEGMIWLLFIVWLLKLRQEKGLTLNPVKWVKNILNPQSLILKEQNPIPRFFRLPMILFLAAATISAFVSPQLQAALGIWKAYFVEALMFFIIFIYNIRTSAQVKQVIRILGVLTIVIGLFAIYQKLTGDLIPHPYWAAEATRRVTTFFGYPNANALLIAPVLMLTIGNLLTDKKFKLIVINLLVLILGILTILWAGSTGALLGIAAGLICFLLFCKKTRIITIAVLAIVLIVSFTQLPAADYLKQTAGSLVYTDLPLVPSDVQIRYQQWKETLTMLKDTPIFGAGLNGYQTLMIPYHQFWHIEIFLYPHNFFLNFWSETGLLGLISIIWILVSFFIISFKFSVFNLKSIKNLKLKTENYNQSFTYQILTITTSCAMITLLVHGLVDVPYFKNDLAILFWIIIGIIIILYNERRRARVVESDGPENR
ncbi:O-antigen ligase family protein [Patescibacteria group bacterium]|nr:O-antigen ligase family protein [Patescibacteria group bacterium]